MSHVALRLVLYGAASVQVTHSLDDEPTARARQGRLARPRQSRCGARRQGAELDARIDAAVEPRKTRRSRPACDGDGFCENAATSEGRRPPLDVL